MSTEEFKHDYGIERVFSSISDIAGKKITIMGLGLHGGGEAVARFLAKHGAKLTITDLQTEKKLKPTLQNLKKSKDIDFNTIDFVLGKHVIEDFENADCVIKNPGVKYDSNIYLAAAKYIETDLSLFLQFCNSPIIAISGSKGKSSTASAIHYGLCKAGFDAKLGGNITVSPLSFIDECTERTPVVIEFSSWQLADLRGRHILKPRIGLLTPIVPDHQNWYRAMEPYVDDKKLIYANQSGDDVLICGSSSKWDDIFAAEAPAHLIRYPSHSTAQWVENISVPGEHQKQNIYNAYLVLGQMGVKDEDAIKIMQAYPGIEHRLEFFYSWNNLKFYNDTTATVPEAAAAAAQSFKEPVHFICGGTDKDLDFNVLAQTLAAHTKKKTKSIGSIRLLAGTGTTKLIKLLKRKKVRYRGPFDDLQSLLEDLRGCFANQSGVHEQTNTVVVFSPGATSFGMFKNEFDRGFQFKQHVRSIFN
ncbi:MAG TPA: UDP-N-acetylmuramoyl-L-alanine--D-glutamate ligase [Treponemataceae bacterium]|nr:UDP-N-acetylmuramoyl-L-alanine--D-glutamate ligase [Treponemataceae bacterium]